MFNKTVLTFGKAEMQMVMNISSLPSAGNAAKGTDYAYAPGGRGSLAAVTLAAHSVGSVFCARLGNDENGETLIRYFDGCNVDTRYMTRDSDEPTGFSVTVNESKGDYSRRIYNNTGYPHKTDNQQRNIVNYARKYCKCKHNYNKCQRIFENMIMKSYLKNKDK